MYCVKCGAKIEDGYKFCPECGAKVVSVDGDTRNEPLEVEPKEETLADIMIRVANEYPPHSTDAIGKLSRITGCGAFKLGCVMASVWAGKDPKTLADYRSLEKKYNKHKNPTMCPKCGSRNTQYKAGSTWAFTSGGTTLVSDPLVTIRCVDCGKQWTLKKNAWNDI